MYIYIFHKQVRTEILICTVQQKLQLVHVGEENITQSLA